MIAAVSAASSAFSAMLLTKERSSFSVSTGSRRR